MEHQYRVRHGLEIVQQLHRFEWECVGDVTWVDAPRDVGQGGRAIDDRTCRAEACGTDPVWRRAAVAKERVDQVWQRTEIQRAVRAGMKPRGTRVRAFEQPEQC